MAYCSIIWCICTPTTYVLLFCQINALKTKIYVVSINCWISHHTTITAATIINQNL
ncbi:Uncharacterised protein [Vibrio cholerae]|nr:Uncharacterised protein [Vibrio cholerae]